MGRHPDTSLLRFFKRAQVAQSEPGDYTESVLQPMCSSNCSHPGNQQEVDPVSSYTGAKVSPQAHCCAPARGRGGGVAVALC